MTGPNDNYINVGADSVNINGTDYYSKEEVYEDYPEMIDSGTVDFAFEEVIQADDRFDD